MRFFFFLFIGWLPAQAQQLLVTPYIQPGNAPDLKREEKVIIWQTDSVAASFKVEYGLSAAFGQSATVNAIPLRLGSLKTILYRATLSDLSFDKSYHYRVSLNGKPIAQSVFTTRSTKPSTRFVVFGDCGIGNAAQAQIAYRAFLEKPEFIFLTGDLVYSRGQVNEYLRKYFPFFNADNASPERGAPLMRSVPFYPAIGNHDVYASDLATYPDGLAYFYYFDLPLNGPIVQHTVEVKGSPEQVTAFKQATGLRFPNMANYSFDYGNVHIVSLDANPHINPHDPQLIRWIETDLKSSRATWKIVAFHHPGFNSSRVHYNQQWMRVLAPVFEKQGVDLVLNGHVHNYQRSFPLKFKPKRNADGFPLIDTLGRVNGRFNLDNTFNGKTKTRPDGVLYVVSGAGGASLYDTAFSNKPELWKHEPVENWAPFTARLISHVHSFSVIETRPNRLIFRQVDAQGNLLDQFEVTK